MTDKREGGRWSIVGMCPIIFTLVAPCGMDDKEEPVTCLGDIVVMCSPSGMLNKELGRGRRMIKKRK
jgi:hypothetical protein